MELIDVILSKGNLNRAYKKVVANKGASGVDGVTVATYHTTYATPYILHKIGKQEHEPKRFTVYHGTFKYQYHNELVCSCVHRYRKIRGSASNRIRSIYHDFNHA